MLFSSDATRAALDLLGIPPMQFRAVAIWYEDNDPPTYRELAERLGVSRPRAWVLVKKGDARLRAHKIDVNNLMAMAPAA